MTAAPRNVATKKCRMVIVDDHPIVRQGLRELLRTEADLELVGEAGTAAEGLKMVESTEPDLLLLDISMRGSSGLELVKAVANDHPDVTMLVLSIHDEALYAERCLKAGARGYVMKQESTENLLAAVRRVRSGEIYVSDRMSSRMLEQLADGGRGRLALTIDPLSDRELEVFLLIGSGLSTRVIAEQLDLSIKTVEAHRAHIKEKLGLRNATDLVKQAVHWAELEGVGARLGS